MDGQPVMRIVLAGGHRMNVHGSTDNANAIRLARVHWMECMTIDSEALNALDAGEVEVRDDDAT